jgi:predicted amidohydrolase
VTSNARVLVAALQLDTRDDPETAWERARELTARAAARGARVVALPENFLDESIAPREQPFETWRSWLAELAHENKVALVAGTVRETAPGDLRPFQTTLVFSLDGHEVHRYRKLHLFDARPLHGPEEHESLTLRPGLVDDVRAFELAPIGRSGVGICYDLRFPELWRRLARDGARTLFVPSSFALGTGKDHWHVLLRARAIENGAYVVAPAQVGPKPGGRHRYGHALVVDPWGTVLADAGGENEGFALAEIEPAFQERVRRALPTLDHARLI